MPTQVEQKVVDPEAELSNAQRTFQKLAPMCSVAKRALGIPQLAPQKNQMGILRYEMKETLLCISLALKGQHYIRDRYIQNSIKKYITELEVLNSELRDERAQQTELDCLNYLAGKKVSDLSKKLPTEADELAILENANNRLRRMENRLDLATKRFCIVNTDNMKTREEIHRLLVEREGFNIMWNRTIRKLAKGKEYFMDILEIASTVFAERDDCCRKLEALKWRGLFQLNKDIAEMQSYEGELNHLAKLEEYLRLKGSVRICEAEEIEEVKRLEEIARCEQEIARFDALMDKILEYADTDSIPTVISMFKNQEISNFSIFTILLEVLQECIMLKKELEIARQKILDQIDINVGRADAEDKMNAIFTNDLTVQQVKTMIKRDQNMNSETLFFRVLQGIDDLVRLARCEITPLLSLLGNHREVTKWNVRKFLSILEIEIKSLIEVAYGAVKPPAPTPKDRKVAPEPTTRLVADPRIVTLRPNRIEKLVPYQPCAYCVEDYMMNQVFETPAVPATREEVEVFFQLEDVNTKFGIFTLTIPSKRHPFRSAAKKD